MLLKIEITLSTQYFLRCISNSFPGIKLVTSAALSTFALKTMVEFLLYKNRRPRIELSIKNNNTLKA